MHVNVCYSDEVTILDTSSINAASTRGLARELNNISVSQLETCHTR